MPKKSLVRLFHWAVLLTLTVSILVPGCGRIAGGDTDDKQLLLIMPEGYGANHFLNRDVMEQYGWHVTLAGLTDTVPACAAFAEPRGVPAKKVDLLLSEIRDIAAYDAVAIMPSTQFASDNPFGPMLENAEAVKLIAAAVKKDVPVFATCAGVRLLAAAHVIRGIEVSGSPKFKAEYEAAGATFVGNDHPPVIRGPIITAARDMYYSIPNVQAIATAIEQREKVTLSQRVEDNSFIKASSFSSPDWNTDWIKMYGGPSADGARVLCETADGGYLLVGYTFSHGGGNADILVIKVTADGEMVWSKTFGETGTEYAYGCTTVNGGYLIIGYTTSSGAGSKDVYLVKIDDRGQELWSKTYGGESWDVGTAAAQTPDGGFVLCGFTHSFGAGEEDICLIKTDSVGNEQWARYYGGKRFEMGNSVFVTPDGGFMIGATTGTTEGGNADFGLIKTDFAGNQLWSKAYYPTGEAGHGYDWCSQVQPAADGGWILAGFTDCNDLLDACVMKVDAEGIRLWERSFGNSFYDYATGVREVSDGGVIVSGVTKSTDGDNNICLTRLDSLGEIVWQQTYGAAQADWAGDVSIARNGGYLVLGQSASHNPGSFDIVLMKVQDPKNATAP